MAELLVVNTGGTIGMRPGPQGLEPAPGLVEAALPPGLAAQVVAFDPLRDSADMGPHDWNRIADLIAASAAWGVLVVHGTDTMAMTGAALAAIGMDRPVVLCGSMQPLGQGGDAEGNLALALEAVQTRPPGVWLAFAGQVFEASALVKTDSHRADSFRAAAHLPQAPTGRRFDPARVVGVVNITPGMAPQVLAAMLAPCDAAVLRVFGAGTFPGNPALAQVLAQAVAQGKRLRAVSQCPFGGLEPGAYAAGAALWAAGVENGGSETPEAALARLWLTD
jgi:L-asparaginase